MSTVNRSANADENSVIAGALEGGPTEEVVGYEINDYEDTTISNNYDNALDDDDFTETFDDIAVHRTIVDHCAHETCWSVFPSDCPNRMCRHCCSQHGQITCPRHDVTVNTTTED